MNRPEQRKQVARLQQISEVMLDARLAALQAAAQARTASLERLADLERPRTADDLSEVAAAEVVMRYQRWADQRRAEINLTLARQTVTWIEARQAAATAFGKSQALEGLARRLK